MAEPERGKEVAGLKEWSTRIRSHAGVWWKKGRVHKIWSKASFLHKIMLYCMVAWCCVAVSPIILLLSSRRLTLDHYTRLKDILQQLGTFGDMFGSLGVLFSGFGLFAVAYTINLQIEDRKAQQVAQDIERARRENEAERRDKAHEEAMAEQKKSRESQERAWRYDYQQQLDAQEARAIAQKKSDYLHVVSAITLALGTHYNSRTEDQNRLYNSCTSKPDQDRTVLGRLIHYTNVMEWLQEEMAQTGDITFPRPDDVNTIPIDVL